MTDLKFPPRGSFAWQTLVGPYTPDPAALLDPSPIFGLERENTAVYGCMRSASGEIYEALRAIRGTDHEGPEYAEAFGGFLLRSTAGHNDPFMHVMPVSGKAASSKHPDGKLENGGAVWSSQQNAEGSPWQVTCDGKTCRWHEENVLDLQGHLIEPGLQWYMPERSLGMYYASLLYEVTGTILEEEVRGFIGIDQIYMPDGGVLYRHKDTLVGQKVHSLWYTWGTRYKDGTLDAGHFIVGHGRSGFALLTNEHGEPYYTNNITARINTRKDESGQEWQDHIILNVDGVDWEFLPDPRGTMPDGSHQATTPQCEGRWRRVGDEREPDVWFAWGEIAPDHGLEYQPRFRS